MDSEFSHKDETTMGDKMLESGVRWKRPMHICNNPRLFVHGPSRFDISQGNFLDLIFNLMHFFIDGKFSEGVSDLETFEFLFSCLSLAIRTEKLL